MAYDQQDDHVTPVLFRMSDGECVAIFPCEPGSTLHPWQMTCYAHIGQHSSCSPEYLALTRPATPTEYVSLKSELESTPYGYRLKVYQRMQPAHREALQANRRRA